MLIANMLRRGRSLIQLAQPTTTRRRNRRIERGLQAEVVWKLKAADIFYIPIPNGMWLGTTTPAERAIAARLVHQMKAAGGMTTGAYDLVLFGRTGRAGLVELKRPAETDLLGNRVTAGQLSKAQREFRDRARAAGVPEAVCHNWDEVLAFWKTL